MSRLFVSQLLAVSLSLSPLAPGGAGAVCSETPASGDASEELLRRAVVEAHADWCFEIYSQTEKRAKKLLLAVDELIEHPEKATLENARACWIDARRLYGQTEALRFHDGPIEPLEPLLNAWPVDEAYIDYVVGREDCGIINDLEGFPSLGGAILELAHERGGEANICLGWHAIEFILWGQDLSLDGAGTRSWTDFAKGEARNAARRCEYLRTVTSILVGHLGDLRRAWAPDSVNYRQRFAAEPSPSIRRMLVGVTVLSAFELGGERLTVAFDTRDQEQEHSCFSDQSRLDLLANQKGVVAVLEGATGEDGSSIGILDLVSARDEALGLVALQTLATTTKALEAIPEPFDRAIASPDGSEGRVAIDTAIRALEEQTDVLLILGTVLGHELPLEPGG